MRSFSIKELQQFSNIQAHTIRIWEKRYSLLTPDRKESNIREYSIDNVKKLLNVALLTKFGHKISKVAALDDIGLEAQAMAMSDPEAKIQFVINQLVYLMHQHDIEEFEKILDQSISTWNIDIVIERILIPFLETVKIFSYKNHGSSDVHFVVPAIRKKIILGIESIPASLSKKSALLFLPKGEHFDLILLYITYLVKKLDVRVLYLGTNVSLQSLEEGLNGKTPSYLITYTSPDQSSDITPYATFAANSLPGCVFVVAEIERQYMGSNKSSKIIHTEYRNIGKHLDLSGIPNDTAL